MNAARATVKPKLLPFVLLSALSMPLLLAGGSGLVLPELAPWFANPTIAWSLIGVGLSVDAAAVASLISEVRRANRARRHNRGTGPRTRS